MFELVESSQSSWLHQGVVSPWLHGHLGDLLANPSGAHGWLSWCKELHPSVILGWWNQGK